MKVTIEMVVTNLSRHIETHMCALRLLSSRRIVEHRHLNRGLKWKSNWHVKSPNSRIKVLLGEGVATTNDNDLKIKLLIKIKIKMKRSKAIAQILRSGNETSAIAPRLAAILVGRGRRNVTRPSRNVKTVVVANSFARVMAPSHQADRK